MDALPWLWQGARDAHVIPCHPMSMSLDFNAIEARENAGGAGSMSQSARKCFKMFSDIKLP